MTGRRIAVRGTRDAVVEEFAVPTALGPGEILVEVACSLISPGTELGAYNAPGRTQAYSPGYTAVGTVQEVGPGADAALAGRRVFLFPHADDSTGCHATHKVLKPGGLALPVPDDLGSAEACFARVANIALTPFCLADAHVADAVLVVGLGMVGNMVGQVGRIRGFRSIGVDPNASRRRRALDAGFDAVIDPSAEEPVAAVKRLTGGRGTDLSVNATGRADTFPMTFEATAPGGEVNTLGGSRHPATVDLSALINLIHVRHLTLRGGWEQSLPRTPAPGAKVRSTEENLRQAFHWLRAGALRLEPVWTHTIRPEGFQDAYDALNRLEDNTFGVVVEWH